MSRSHSKSGFTLVELLVVIGIIALLVGILVPAVNKAYSCARQIRSVSGLRQLMTGYTMYHQDNRGALLLGYPTASVSGVVISATDPKTGITFTSPIADRYPWRLVKYCGNIWPIIHSHTNVPPVPESATDPKAWDKAYLLSLNPTYGINSTFVGGDRSYDGFVAPNSRPNTGKHVVFKATEVKHSTRLIVFAESRAVNTGQPEEGMHFLTPPRAKGIRWTVVNNKIVPASPSLAIGVPKGWFSPYVAVGFFDGHVETLDNRQLLDMRYWANRADSADYDF